MAHRFGSVSLLALDWKKAFDRVSVASLIEALRRFGIPQHFCFVVDAIMNNRAFFVTSSARSLLQGRSPQEFRKAAH